MSTRHPFTRALYTLRADGNVDVVEGDRRGVFAPDGRWLEGELREADPQVCVWVANVPGAQQAGSDSHITTARPGN